MIMSYLLLMIFFFEQKYPHTATPMEEVCGPPEGLLKNKPYLVIFHESILVSSWIFSADAYLRE